MSSTGPFLSLPPEIRNGIYGYCTPISAPVSSYDGLLLSCKQIRSEFPVQALKSFNEVIKSVEEDLAAKSCHVTISHPSTFSNNVPNGIGYISLTIGDIRTQLPYDIADMLAPILSSHYRHFMVFHTHVAYNPYHLDLRLKINFLIAKGRKRT